MRMSCDNKKGHSYPSTAGGEHCTYMCCAGVERVIDTLLLLKCQELNE